MAGKRDRVAALLAKSGATRVLEALPKRKALVILNYHRVGDPSKTPYDSGTFGPTAEAFDWELTYLKRNFACVTLEEALEMVAGKAPLRSSLLLTFDDGYRDNYQIAFPLLRSHGIQAVFFLPTAFIGTQRLPWWDVIAYIVKNSRRDVIRLQYPEPAEFSIPALGAATVVLRILYLCVNTGASDYGRLIEELETVCDCPRPDGSAERCFMDWNEAREMQTSGMAFGSHSHSHEVLSGLTPEQQVRELCESRAILERELGRAITVMSYPVGMPYTFDNHTADAIKTAGYTAAFSFYGGLNNGRDRNPLDLRRCVFSSLSRSRYRLAAVSRTLLNREF